MKINLPSISVPTAPGAGFNAPSVADRIDSGPTIKKPTITVSSLSIGAGSGAGSGGGSGGGSKSIVAGAPGAFNPQAGDNPAVNALTTFGVAERIAAMESAKATASPINITVNTVTADANLPTFIVEQLQRYNLISGPVDVQIAV
jgi:hypothetical protein